MDTCWHVVTLSWSQVRKEKHVRLAELAEHGVKQSKNAAGDEARMQSEMISGGKMRLYLSPGVMKCVGERMLEAGAEACDAPPNYFPTTFAAA